MLMIYILHGADSFSRQESLHALQKELDEDGSLATNTSSFSATQTTAQEVMAACSAHPFLGNRRLVILEGLLRLVQGEGGRRGKRGGDSEAAYEWAVLVNYTESMPDWATLILVDGEVRADNAVMKVLSGRAEVRAFPPKGPKELPRWVQARARRIGLRLEDRAARLIAQTAGDQERRPGQEYVDLWALANELDKLACFAGGEMVREADVQALTPVLRDQKGYFLCDALAEGRSAAAVKLLRELLAQDEPTQVILSTIAGRYRRLAIARELMDRGESSAAVGAATRTSGYALEKQMEQASRHNQERLRRIYRRVVEADLEAKLGERDEAVALELLVHDLASPAPEAE